MREGERQEASWLFVDLSCVRHVCKTLKGIYKYWWPSGQLRAPSCVSAVSQSLTRPDTYCGVDGNKESSLAFKSLFMCTEFDKN